MKYIYLYIICHLVIITLLGCKREQTIYASDFNQTRFWESKLGTTIDSSLSTVGMPLSAWLYYTDANPDHKSHQIIPLTRESLLASSRIPQSYIVCYYSVQGNTNKNYIRCELYFEWGRLAKKLEGLVTE